MAKNGSLYKARNAKDDEFYTQISDIEKELKNYKDQFKDKHVFLNCDDPEISNFWRYFVINFHNLELKQLTSTHYREDKSTYRQDMYRQGEEPEQVNKNISLFNTLNDERFIGYETPLKGNGDFRSKESLQILKTCDIVVTNPPFSLFREYINQLIEFDKKFIVIGSQNAVTYGDIFPLFQNNKMWLGYKSGDMAFKVPEHYEPRNTRFWIDETGQKWRSMGNICWYTNIEHDKRYEELFLYKTYNPKEYPKYDGYDIINVDKVKDIPMDYDGLMGVPITFLSKYNPNQFDILGLANSARYIGDFEWITLIAGRKIYNRILIKRKDRIDL